jgi:hypothetical protein
MTGSSLTRKAPVVRTIARRRANSRVLRFHSSDHVGTMGRQGSAPLIGLPVRQPSVISTRGQIRRPVGPRIPSLSGRNTGSIDGGNLPTINPRSSIFAEESALLQKDETGARSAEDEQADAQMHHIISELFLEPEDSASVAPSDSEQSSEDLPITASVDAGT